MKLTKIFQSASICLFTCVALAAFSQTKSGLSVTVETKRTTAQNTSRTLTTDTKIESSSLTKNRVSPFANAVDVLAPKAKFSGISPQQSLNNPTVRDTNNPECLGSDCGVP